MTALLRLNLRQSKFILMLPAVLLLSIVICVVQAVDSASTDSTFTLLGAAIRILSVTTFLSIALPLYGNDKTQSDSYIKLSLSLPITRKEIVQSHFVTTYIFAGIISILSALSYMIMGLVRSTFNPMYMIDTLFLPILVVGLLGSIYILLFFAFKKSRYVMIAIYFISFLNFMDDGQFIETLTPTYHLGMIGFGLLLEILLYHAAIFFCQRREII